MKSHTPIAILALTLACLGCQPGDSETTARELLRRQQRQNSREATVSRSPESKLAEANIFFQQRNYVEASRILRPLLIEEPDAADVLTLAANCLAAEGDIEAAEELIDRISPEATPEFILAMEASAGWLTTDRQYEKAEQRLTTALSLIKDDSTETMAERRTRLQHRIAALLNNQGKRQEAANYLRRLAESGDITEKELFALNTLSDAFIDTTMPKPDVGNELTPAALAVARLYRADRKLDEALRLARRLNAAFPDSVPIAAFYCRLLLEMNEDDTLRSILTKSPRNATDHPSFWFVTGTLLQRDERHQRAARCLVEAISLDPTDRMAFLALSRSLEKLSLLDEAELAHERYQWLSEAAHIVDRIGIRPGTQEEIVRLAELLQKLERLPEASAWLKIDATLRPGAVNSSRRLNVEQAISSTRDADGWRNASGLLRGDLGKWSPPDPHELTSSLALKDTSDWPDHTTETQLGQSKPPIVLDNITDQVGLSFQYNNGADPNSTSHALHQLTGGGIAAIDYDLDGFPDLYLVQGGGDAFDTNGSQANVLFRNLDGTRWQNTGPRTGLGDLGYGQGATAVDINQDGFTDILVANIGPNVYYQNNGDGTFTSRQLGNGQISDRWTSSIICGDLSGDGLPELIEINYVDDDSALTTQCTPQHDICNPSAFRPALDRAWQTNPDGTIEQWNGCLGMQDRPNYGFGGIITNFDGLAGNDIFIANDTEANHFWRSVPPDHTVAGKELQSNEHNYRLNECAAILGCAFGVLGQRNGCMGVAAGDFDRNGLLDLHVTNFWNQSADLYLQQPGSQFINGAGSAGIYEPSRLTVGWGTQAADFDRDGHLDIAVLNGNLVDHRWKGRPYQMLPQLFRGGFGKFNIETPRDPYWSTPALGRIMATLDWNRDGKLDLVVNHLDRPVTLLENRTTVGNGVQFCLVGVHSERDAIGATLKIRCADETWHGWVTGGDGMLCTNQKMVEFGIAEHASIDSLEITWPTGDVQRIDGLPANRCFTVVEGLGVVLESSYD
ncbi:FG-GAP-like repeat-containing protein [Roseiconus lacunae]|uniref:FG-GAP-like repeat-containing protein n=1 Tax=Roseiconus lacunae TaxID=2605694 RepID=A0ABT7PGV0_9BACT|nr:FG-GAP-like repeat-containing protein [Roseiconus lacunae]MDM4015715.1 FG-GAP-like repeat-containing protein [Roseiconus lacunae]